MLAFNLEYLVKNQNAQFSWEHYYAFVAWSSLPDVHGARDPWYQVSIVLGVDVTKFP